MQIQIPTHVITKHVFSFSGTDSPFRETSNIYDGSAVTADMAVQGYIFISGLVKDAWKCHTFTYNTFKKYKTYWTYSKKRPFISKGSGFNFVLII